MKPTFGLDDMQTTIGAPASLTGIGVHSGRFTSCTLHPAPANTGIIFRRIDIDGDDNIILAHASNAVETQLCTRIENASGIGVNMIEHLMAAFHGLGLDNLIIDIDSGEVPILDGSSAIIVEVIERAGIVRTDTPRSYIEILAPVRAELENGAWAELSPSDHLQMDITIDFDDPAIGKQHLAFDAHDDCFIKELSEARTFCLFRDVEIMRNAGLAKGGSLDNALVYDNGTILNKSGLRMENECVRHKALDCMGDLFLLGMAVKGRMTSEMPGHRLSTILVRALLDSPESFRIVSHDESLSLVSQVEMMPIAASA
ncbi:MAG: UDP-3-O-acyl-N-acetylglucosamine deacetylase [Candidatus Puniceispirillaceae bacterium]